MSIKLMTAVTQHGPAKSSQRFVLLMIADRASDDGSNAWPAIETLASQTALSERTVLRAIDGLVRDGYLIRRRRKNTSNTYQIVVEKLRLNSVDDTTSPVGDNLSSTVGDTMSPVGDNLSPLYVTPCHPVGDNLSPLYVTPCHPVGDNLSPDPSLNHPINHQGNHPARETAAQPAPAVSSPPLVRIKSEPRDRTPGGNGYHPPKEPIVPKREPSPEVAEVGAIANALTDVTGVSARLNWDRVGGLAAELHGAGYKAAEIMTAYSRQPTAGWHWYTNDWRGRKGDRPTPENVRETIAGATAPIVADVKIHKPNAIQRALAAFGTAPQLTGDNPI